MKILNYDASSIYFYSVVQMFKKVNLNYLSAYLNDTSRVVVRTDFNVPIKGGVIQDFTRLKSTIPTIQHLVKHSPKSIVLLSHLGRPGGRKDQTFTLRPLLDPLQNMLGRPVTFLDDCIGEHVVDKVNNSNGEIFLCENIRFKPEQEGYHNNNEGVRIKVNQDDVSKFRKELSRLGNIFVNDAFGCSHRAHSSVVGIQHEVKAAGLLMERQLKVLGSFLEAPKRPVLVIMGGSKVTDKIKLIMKMLDFADELIIGGGMSAPFLRQVYGNKLGSTRVVMPQDPSSIRMILQKAKERGIKIHLPVDGVCAQTLSETAPTRTFKTEEIPDGWQMFDHGADSLSIFNSAVSRAESIFWNGPIGVFQMSNFQQGSETLLRSIVARTKAGATSVIGGGDTANLANKFGLRDQVSYISTGGGATLQFIQGMKLPGVQALHHVN